MFSPEKGGADYLTSLINYGGFVCNLAAAEMYLLAAIRSATRKPDMPGTVPDQAAPSFLVTAGLGWNILAMVDAFAGNRAAGRRLSAMPEINLSTHFEALRSVGSVFVSDCDANYIESEDAETKLTAVDGFIGFACSMPKLFGIGWARRNWSWLGQHPAPDGQVHHVGPVEPL